MNSQTSIIVTGGNSGIGFGSVSLIIENGLFDQVILTARSQEKIDSTVEQLSQKFGAEKISSSVSGCILDLMDTQSIDSFVQQIKSTHGQVDTLLNNAGVYLRGEQYSETEVATTNVTTNYINTRYITDQFLASDLIKKSGKIMIVSSAACKIDLMQDINPEFTAKVKNYREFNLAKVDELFSEYWTSISAGFDKTKWPNSYFTSKMFISIYSNVITRTPTVIERDISVYNLHPGYIRTKMSKFLWDTEGGPTKTVEDSGTKTIEYLLRLPSGIQKEFQGEFFNHESGIEDLNSPMNN